MCQYKVVKNKLKITEKINHFKFYLRFVFYIVISCYSYDKDFKMYITFVFFVIFMFDIMFMTIIITICVQKACPSRMT